MDKGRSFKQHLSTFSSQLVSLRGGLLVLFGICCGFAQGSHLIITVVSGETAYPIRWGITDSMPSDTVASAFPACFSMGNGTNSYLEIQVILDPGDNPNTVYQIFPGGLYSYAYTLNSTMPCCATAPFRAQAN